MQILDTTQQQMFALLRSSLWGVDRFPVQILEDVDWEAVYSELRDQTVNHIVADVFCPMNTPVSQKCLMDTTYGIAVWYKLMTVQKTIHEILAQNNIKYTILKGATACINYPKPTYRSMGDIDILVAPQNYEKTIDILAGIGFNKAEKVGDRHTQLFQDGVEVEVHRYYSVLADKEAFDYFENELLVGLENTIEVQIEGFKFNMLQSMETGLVFLEHIDHHLHSGIGLRQIIDWMMYVDKYLSDEVWYETFVERAKKIGLDTMAIVITRMCQMYLGLREDITWCKEADEQLCSDLMRITMDRGNFGRKYKSAREISTVLHAASGMKGTLRMLQYRGTVNWKTLEKHPWLTPFAWVYQICRYIRKGLKIKNPFKSLIKQAKATSEQKEVFSKMGATSKSEGIETPFGKQY